MAEWLKLKQIADELNVHYSTVLRWVTEGKLPAHRVGAQWRIGRDELNRWIASGGATEDNTGRNSRAPGNVRGSEPDPPPHVPAYAQ